MGFSQVTSDADLLADLEPRHGFILERLGPLDLTAKLQPRKPKVVRFGAFSDVFQSKCRVEERGDVPVAIKRLRMVLEGDMKKVSSLYIQLHSLKPECP